VALQRALVAAGCPAPVESSFAARLAQARAATTHRWLDHALVKFVLFPLLPAAVAFRLHQMIAFGGVFGEYYTYGLTAWLTGALIWWASWALGLMLLAALLRVAIELLTLVTLPALPDRALAMRDAMSWLGRLAYYLGVPAWLALRLVSG
jgi:apolipoprotein N-acyltransferase